jgi:hypothetical protein
MPVMIQISNVRDVLHRQLKSRAALAGMSLSDYLLSEIRQVAELRRTACAPGAAGQCHAIGVSRRRGSR